MCRLRHKDDNGKPSYVQNHTINKEARVNIIEGQYNDPWHLAEWDRQCSQHVCHEHWHSVPFSKETRKVSSGGRSGEEENVPGGMPLSTSKFSSFLTPMYRLPGVEAAATLKKIANRLAKKCHQPYYTMCWYANIRISITFVRATHRYIRGSRVTAHNISVQCPQWEDSAGLKLFR